MIQSQRRDNGGSTASIRSEDMRAIELLLGSVGPRRRAAGRLTAG